jgi:tRNA pseudouridine55 synthase
MKGILLVDKPQGWTSFDVVNKVRRVIQNSPLNETGKKRFPVGHTGTLDPLASGLLVLLLGTYTKRATELIKLDKTYEVTMKLGQNSSTGDEEGEKTHIADRQPTQQEIAVVLSSFVGDSLQTPPVYSAIKVNGQRAYKLAREGKTVELTPRPVHIEDIHLTSYDYPIVTFTTHVSSGTYIRSLVEDMGKKLQTGAYMCGLRRTTVGSFDITDAMDMSQLTVEEIAAKTFEIES